MEHPKLSLLSEMTNQQKKERQSMRLLLMNLVPLREQLTQKKKPFRLHLAQILPPPAQSKTHSQRPQTQRARKVLPLLPKLKRTGLRPS
uniref:Uncharacterized protein n=1 Tax=Siphoviridae sp. ctQqU1 TaxID=2825496 RepID=A0A8S5Q4W7_9CAUD|nr:MAG TPA: hypothetical protein [Siphoviridae sp. ctQqU1]